MINRGSPGDLTKALALLFVSPLEIGPPPRVQKRIQIDSFDILTATIQPLAALEQAAEESAKDYEHSSSRHQQERTSQILNGCFLFLACCIFLQRTRIHNRPISLDQLLSIPVVPQFDHGVVDSLLQFLGDALVEGQSPFLLKMFHPSNNIQVAVALGLVARERFFHQQSFHRSVSQQTYARNEINSASNVCEAFGVFKPDHWSCALKRCNRGVVRKGQDVREGLLRQVLHEKSCQVSRVR
mmetsp:Transcript_48850/g.95813  ORF Transcript_48850/g.95813 Transcript_48850/m.95813 type:complete len:241 (-) Transcript_48850:316-1038(-)